MTDPQGKRRGRSRRLAAPVTEAWLVIPSSPSYLVSSEGRVWSVAGGRLVTQSRDNHGYWRVSLRSGGRNVTRRVHTLVAEAFIGPRPAGQHVRHLDSDQDNNTLLNLLYGTASENEQDKRSRKRKKRKGTRGRKEDKCNRLPRATKPVTPPATAGGAR